MSALDIAAAVRSGERSAVDVIDEHLARIEAVLPVGWCHGDRYNEDQWVGPERYC